MLPAVRALYALNAASPHPFKVVIAAAGGGVEGIRQLLATEGASSLILECSQPYSREAFTLWCGDGPGGQSIPPDFQFASYDAALALASASLRRAKRIASTWPGGLADMSASRLAGVGLAGALRSEPPRRGTHRCHVVVATDACILTREVVLDKGAGRSRAAEDAACGRLLFEALSDALGAGGDAARAPGTPAEIAAGTAFAPGDAIAGSSTALADPVSRLLAAAAAAAAPVPGSHETAPSLTAAGPVTHVLYPPSGGPVVNALLPARTVVLPGSFNPLHTGHTRLGAAAALAAHRHSGSAAPWQVAFELAAVNVDKPPLSAEAVAARVSQFAPPAWERIAGSAAADAPGGSADHPAPHDGAAVVVSACARFVEKARLFPGAAFAVSCCEHSSVPLRPEWGFTRILLICAGRLRHGCSPPRTAILRRRDPRSRHRGAAAAAPVRHALCRRGARRRWRALPYVRRGPAPERPRGSHGPICGHSGGGLQGGRVVDAAAGCCCCCGGSCARVIRVQQPLDFFGLS